MSDFFEIFSRAYYLRTYLRASKCENSFDMLFSGRQTGKQQEVVSCRTSFIASGLDVSPVSQIRLVGKVAAGLYGSDRGDRRHRPSRRFSPIIVVIESGSGGGYIKVKNSNIRHVQRLHAYQFIYEYVWTVARAAYFPAQLTEIRVVFDSSPRLIIKVNYLFKLPWARD